MLIINVTNYTKPYIVMQVGRTKFIIQPKYNILLIIHSGFKYLVTVYRNDTLLGQLAHYGIGTTPHADHTKRNKYIVCGTIYGLDAQHSVPFYEYPDGVSIFGYRVIQYQYDCVAYRLHNETHEKIILQI